MAEALATAGAGVVDPVGLGRDLVVEVAAEHAILDQHGALGGVALVVDVQRATGAVEGAVVTDGNVLVGDALPHAAGVDADPLAVEVGLHAMADGLVEQDGRGAGGEDHGHLSCRGLAGVEQEEGPVDRLGDQPLLAFRVEVLEASPSRDVVGRRLADAVLAGAAAHVGLGHGAPVLDEAAVGTHDHHHAGAVGEECLDPLDARVAGEGGLLPVAHQRHPGGHVDAGPGLLDAVVAGDVPGVGHRGGAARGARGDLGGGPGGGEEAVRFELLGVGVAHLITDHDAHAHAEIDRGVRPADSLVGQLHRGAGTVLEVEVAVLATAGERGVEDASEQLGADPELLEVGAGGTRGLGDGHAFLGLADRGARGVCEPRPRSPRGQRAGSLRPPGRRGPRTRFGRLVRTGPGRAGSAP